MSRKRIHLVSYATPGFVPAQRLLRRSALEHGVDVVHDLGPLDLPDAFRARHKSILEHPRGAGFWLWKPYLILETLKRAGDDAIVIYADAGVEVISDLVLLADMCAERGGILLFGTHGHRNRTWTRRDCFVLMRCDAPKYWEAEQFMGGFQVYRKCDPAMGFVGEILEACSDERIIADIPNTRGLENLPGFKEHRCDQSVLSILAVKHGIPAHRDPSQWGNHLKLPCHRRDGEWVAEPYLERPLENSPYPTLLNHHRGTRGLPAVDEASG